MAAAAFSACSSTAKLVGQGGACEQASDCDNDLICIPQKDGSRICSNDLSQVQTPPYAQDSGAAPEASATPAEGGAAVDGPVTTTDTGGGTQPDTSTPVADTSTPIPDTSTPADTSTPPADTSTGD
jgi:hypothetical protein